jgi:predicted MFS family arabinose efflux permease
MSQPAIQLGLRENWAQFSLLVLVNAFVGATVGMERSIMKIDLAGPKNRGLAMGLNEFAGYFAVALSALATGIIAAEVGLRPQPSLPHEEPEPRVS